MSVACIPRWRDWTDSVNAGVYLCTSIQHAHLLAEKRSSTSTATFVYLSWTSICLFMLTTTVRHQLDAICRATERVAQAVCSDMAFLASMMSEELGPRIDFSGYNLKHIINVACTLVAVAVSDAFLVRDTPHVSLSNSSDPILRSIAVSYSGGRITGFWYFHS